MSVHKHVSGVGGTDLGAGWAYGADESRRGHLFRRAGVPHVLTVPYGTVRPLRHLLSL